MIGVLRQKKINKVMGAILCGLAYEQELNATPIQLSIGLPEGRSVMSNCILIYTAPREILKCLADLEQMYPGVEVHYGFGNAAAYIDCEHVVMDFVGISLGAKIRQLIGGGA